MLIDSKSEHKSIFEEVFADSEWTKVSKDDYKKLTTIDKLKRIRHSCSHILAQVFLEKYPEAKLATGPATRDGFFYDFNIEGTLHADDIKELQKMFVKACKKAQVFEYTKISKSKARRLFEATGQTMKVQVLENIKDEQVTFFKNGNFLDLCGGPHVPNTNSCIYTKILDATSAHWRGETTPSLTRVKGVSWDTDKGLNDYMKLLKEIKKRDHRTLGPQVGLFHFHEYGASPFWDPKGVKLRKTVMKFWEEYLNGNGYIEILNPLLYKKELFECSGHWEHYRDDMFIFNDDDGEPDFVLKPMNCPDTMLFFKSRTRSYRELPLRVAEGQILHRNEAAGSLHGIMRTRSFVQDDAHIFLSSEMVESEIGTLMKNIKETYELLELDYSVALSTRPEKFLGEKEIWDKAESDLKDALNSVGQSFRVDEGEGAFYGPKIDITIHDSLGRDWQCGTVQLDFQLPGRFNLSYTDKDGSEKCPIVVHRAIFGSFERFLGILVEHFGGAFPTWLAPVQVAIIAVSENFSDYVDVVAKRLKDANIEFVVLDQGSLNSRIRNSFNNNKIPNLFIIGQDEVDNKTITLRKIKEKDQSTIPLEEVATLLENNVKNRVLDVLVDNPAAFLKEYEDVSSEDEVY